jgi:hypothetical protein
MPAHRVRAHREDDIVDREPGGVLDLANVIEIDLGERHMPGPGEGRVVRATRGGEGAGRRRGLRLAIVANETQRRPRRSRQDRRSRGRFPQQLSHRAGSDRQWCGQRGGLPRRIGRRDRPWLGLEIQERRRELGAGDAVHGGVVHLGHRPDHAALEAFDDVHLPRRSPWVERPADHVGGELLQLRDAARAGTRTRWRC